MKEVSLLMCKELLYYWCWISVTIAWKRNTVFSWIWRNFEWVRCFWVQTRVQTYIDRANKQGQGFFVDKKREHLLVMLNVFYRGVKNYFVLIWTNFEWVRCFWVCIIDSIAVCALFLWQVWWAHKNGRGPNRIGLCHR